MVEVAFCFTPLAALYPQIGIITKVVKYFSTYPEVVAFPELVRL